MSVSLLMILAVGSTFSFSYALCDIYSSVYARKQSATYVRYMM